MDKKHALNIGKFLVRWGIAVVGIWWVISKMSWHDHVWAVLPGQTMPTKNLVLATDHATDQDLVFKVWVNGQVVSLSRDQVVNEPDRDNLNVFGEGKVKYVVGVDLSADLKHVNRLLVADSPTGPANWAPAEDFPQYQISVPHPRVQVGVLRMIREANINYLLAALAIFPITILITSLRWHELLKALDIRLTLSRTFVLNMVGMFYNTIMPLGSSGGDVLKAYYVAKQTHHRTRAVMSVLVDRIVGLLALIILGGTMAAFQRQIPRCRQVAMGSAGILAIVFVSMVVFYSPVLRRLTGFDFIVSRLPKQKLINNAIETMHIYGRRPFLSLGALVVSFPVHMIVITAAQLCGIAFGLHLSLFYYWMAVPVMVLAAAIPISPQGAGVMEYFAIKLLEPQGVTVAQAFALTMSIRLTQIIWNIVGGIFVVRGGFHKPTETEQKQVEEEDEDEDHGEKKTVVQSEENNTVSESRV
jgi:uncharacterized protein (TIRG00374 family)